MLDRMLLLALTPLALAGGTATSWVQTRLASPELHSGAVAVGAPAAVSAGALPIARGADGLLHTTARVNGLLVDFVVDTGASRTILSDRDARRVFAGSPARSLGTIRTLAGERPLRVQQARRVELGGRTYTGLEAGTVTGAKVSVIGLDWLGLAGPITLPTQS